MPESVLLSSAYFPPAEYFNKIKNAGEVMIEKEENYIKQSYRNRCYIHSPNGPQCLTVPVLRGSFHKTPVKEIRIDYSKRWQQVHVGAIKASYTASPYFIHYYEDIECLIMKKHSFLLDLNMDILHFINQMLGLKIDISYTVSFSSVNNLTNDFRYSLTPKLNSYYKPSGNYIHVFGNQTGFFKGLSIIDMLFNTGPDTLALL